MLLRSNALFMQEIFQSMVDHAHVRNVYGEPVAAGDKTIVPVARISYGFGGGSRGQNEGGGGGGLTASPVGFIEVTPAGTRFVSFGDRRRLAGALILGFSLGMLLAKHHAGGRKGILKFL